MAKSKSMCSGCRNDYYNHNVDGGCWSYDSARIVSRVEVGIWENPPYAKERAKKVLSCFCPQGKAMLKLDDPRIKTRKQIDAARQ